MITKTYVKHLNYEATGAAIEVHKALGPGLLESIYEACLSEELVQRGLQVTRQLPVPIWYKGKKVKDDLYIDLLVNDTIIIEVKAVEHLLPVHEAQLLTYLKLAEKPKGLLINFNVAQLTHGIKPFVNQLFQELPQ